MQKSTDHLGNTYPSVAAMCKHYNIQETTYRQRIKRGLSLEEALCMPSQKASNRYQDALGRTFTTKTDMFKYYGISATRYYDRLRSGLSEAEALTLSVGYCNCEHTWTDHLGNQYATVDEMCEKYNITRTNYFDRINKLNWSIERTLTTPIKKNMINKKKDS